MSCVHVVEVGSSSLISDPRTALCSIIIFQLESRDKLSHLKQDSEQSSVQRYLYIFKVPKCKIFFRILTRQCKVVCGGTINVLVLLFTDL